MARVGETWNLKLSTIKAALAVFHLNNKEAKRELKVNNNNETIPFCSEPTFIRVTLDRSLTYRRHHESLRKKLTSRVALLRWLADCWGLIVHNADRCVYWLMLCYCYTLRCNVAHAQWFFLFVNVCKQAVQFGIWVWLIFPSLSARLAVPLTKPRNPSEHLINSS